MRGKRTEAPAAPQGTGRTQQHIGSGGLVEEEEMKRKHIPALWERIFRGTAYASVGFAGIAIILFYNSMGWLVIAWAVFLLAGLPAAVSSWRGRYRSEYAFLPVMLAGLIIYALYEWIETFVYLPSIAAALLATGIVAKFLSRLAHLHAFLRLLKEGQ